MYSKRIQTLCSLFFPVERFADIGCDHGYCSEYMLKNKLCNEAIVTDVSAECLKKAEILLSEYIREGSCVSLCTNGLQGVDPSVDLVLIAGMGGIEIVNILTANEGFIPNNFILQPMRDSESVRRLLLRSGAKIERDFTFFDGKFYNVITGKKSGGTSPYSQAEFIFGRENIRKRSEDFLRFLTEEIQKKKAILTRPLKERDRLATEEKLYYLQGVLDGEIK